MWETGAGSNALIPQGLSLLDARPLWVPNMTTQSKSEQLRIRAYECEVKAEAAHDPDIRRLYRDMAVQWRQMARQHDELGLYDRAEPSRYR